MKKRWLSMFLALALCCTLAPAAHAWTDPQKQSFSETGYYALAFSTTYSECDSADARQLPTIYAGNYCSAVIAEDNSLWMWGRTEVDSNFNKVTRHMIGPLYAIDPFDAMVDYKGLNSSTTWHFPARTTPIKVMDDVAFIGCQSILKTDGSLWMWGSTEDGHMGIGPELHGDYDIEGYAILQTVPLRVQEDLLAVKCDYKTASAIDKDNVLWHWGDGIFTPEKVMEDVVASGGHIALKADGSLWDCSGDEGNVKIMDDVNKICGNSAAIKNDGSLWVWGKDWDFERDTWGEYDPTPRKIADNVMEYQKHVWKEAILKTDGTLWFSDPYFYPTPTKMLDDVVDFSWGNDHIMALKADGTVWTYGGNAFYQLGTGDARDSFKRFQQVPGLIAKLPGTPPQKELFDLEKLPPENAVPTASTVLVNGKQTAFDAYNIGGNNYFKLRDLAYVLNGTDKQFEVSWDGEANAISLTSGQAYTPVGGEMSTCSAGTQIARRSTSRIQLDGQPIRLTAYNIGGNNYFKLRDLGMAFDFGVDWDENSRTISISTNKEYTPE